MFNADNDGLVLVLTLLFCPYCISPKIDTLCYKKEISMLILTSSRAGNIEFKPQ